MKKTLVTLLTVFFAVSAFASQLPRPDFPPVDLPVAPVLETMLTTLEIDENSYLASERLNGGSILIDMPKNEITLTLYRDFHCPVGMFCAQVMPAPVIIKISDVRVEPGFCGSIIYVAEVDKTPVDGLYQELRIHDLSMATCVGIIPDKATSVKYTTFNPWANQGATDVFYGYSLKRSN